MHHITPYIPKMSAEGLINLIENENFSIKVVKERITKHGDFRKLNNQKSVITVNKSNNKYRFLMTLIHEIAHYYTYRDNKFAKPHGLKWKNIFKKITEPFLNINIFPKSLLVLLRNHMEDPKSSFSYDSELSKELDKYDDDYSRDLVYLDDLPLNSAFIYRDKKYIKVQKKRKRYLCKCLTNKRNYLFVSHARVSTL